MGWLFGKKKTENMDIPPPPPTGLGGEGEEMKEFPSIDSFDNNMEMPEETAAPAPEAGDAEFPELPPLTNEGDDFNEIAPIKPKAPVPKPVKEEKPETIEPKVTEETVYSGEEETPISVEEVYETEEIEGPKFLNMHQFQEIIIQTEGIQASIKAKNGIANNLADLREQEEVATKKIRVDLENIDKKLNYIDDVIFRGE